MAEPGADPVAGPVEPIAVAFYLPQFHPTPENDVFWGRGFTEWQAVAGATPHHRGHDQPRVPADLGFYDLRVAESRAEQADLARRYGLDGFLYYHYWFGGRRLLDRPFDEVLASGEPDFPFALCWANEAWHRRWHLGDGQLLVPEEHHDEERAEHLAYLVAAFADPRYLRIDGRPLFCIYRSATMPDPAGFCTELRAASIAAGTGDPYLVRFNTFGARDDPRPSGFDAAAHFPPHLSEDLCPEADPPDDVRFAHRWHRHEDFAAAYLADRTTEWVTHECVVPAWDNSPRKTEGGGVVLLDASNDVYERWLATAAERSRAHNGLVFINAWNEWAEGAFLEPDRSEGHARLAATARALGRSPRVGAAHSPEAPGADAGALPVNSSDTGSPVASSPGTGVPDDGAPDELGATDPRAARDLSAAALRSAHKIRVLQSRLLHYDRTLAREVDRRTEELRAELVEERRRADLLAERLAALLDRVDRMAAPPEDAADA